MSESFKDLCYSIPVDLIASWCCVDIQTARHYKAGTREPGKSAARLFALNLNGLIVPAEWQGYSFRGGQLWDPYGKPFTFGQLNVYGLAWQIFFEWTRDDVGRRATLDDLMRSAESQKLGRAGSRGLAAPPDPKSPKQLQSPETVRRANLTAALPSPIPATPGIRRRLNAVLRANPVTKN